MFTVATQPSATENSAPAFSLRSSHARMPYASPAMATSADGGFLACYDSTTAQAFGFNPRHISLERYDATGERVAVDTLITGPAVNTTVTPLADGGTVVVYETTTGSDHAVWFTIRNADGSRRTIPRRIGSPGSSLYGSAVTARHGSRWTVTYVDGATGAFTKARFDANGVRCKSWRVTN
jgi:hypothetical protein